MADEKDQAEEATKSGPSTMKIVIIAVIASVVLSGGMIGGFMMFMGDDAEVAAEQAEDSEGEEVAEMKLGPPQYHAMDPKFVISFSDQRRARFMQFSLQLMTRDNEVMKLIDAHMPAIRSSLLMLFGAQKYEDMITIEGKKRLLQEVVANVNETLQAVAADEDAGVVEQAYFDSFVIQ